MLDTGLISNLRSGPYLVSSQEGWQDPNAEFTALHWATLITALQRLHDDPQTSQHPNVLKAISEGFTGCTVFRGDTPSTIRAYPDAPARNTATTPHAVGRGTSG